MTRALFRLACATVGIAAFLLAELLDDDAVRSLFPNDADYEAFADDPDAWPLLWVQVNE